MTVISVSERNLHLNWCYQKEKLSSVWILCSFINMTVMYTFDVTICGHEVRCLLLWRIQTFQIICFVFPPITLEMKKQHLQQFCFINLYCGVIFFFHSVFPVHHNNYNYSKHDDTQTKRTQSTLYNSFVLVEMMMETIWWIHLYVCQTVTTTKLVKICTAWISS
jgi:hypothetical protein